MSASRPAMLQRSRAAREWRAAYRRCAKPRSPESFAVARDQSTGSLRMSIDSGRDLILFGLRMRTEAYRDAFATLGYDVAVDVTRPSAEQLSRAALCFIGLYDGVRRPWETLRLKRALA